ncbi:MAG TPA: dihydrofolate reductase [Candidatus Paceibacterota bacterium]|nr:dihydrofolate reductase [Candidatus Paceibacterota bacterium]
MQRYEIALIAAMNPQRVIGADGEIPWHVKADMQHFKEMTMGHDVVMGRRTYESIRRMSRNGHVLPGRHVIILSLTLPSCMVGGETVARSVEEALEYARMPQQRLFVAGGGEIYQLFFPRATSMYLTRVETSVEGSDALTYFPEWNMNDWEEMWCKPLAQYVDEPAANVSYWRLL